MPKQLEASNRAPIAGARATGAADPAERLEVTVLLRRNAASDFDSHVAQFAQHGKSARPAHLSRDEFAAKYGAVPADVALVKAFATENELVVVQADPSRRTVILSGTVAQFQTAFGVQLQQYAFDGGTYRGRTGTVQLPDQLDGVVEAVLGLDNRPQAQPHFRIGASTNGALTAHAAPAAPSTSFSPPQVAGLYNFPAGTGSGQTIALIELGGGYRPADLKAYFAQLSVAEPLVTSISVDHAQNHPTGTANGPDGEVLLDIEVAGSIAPGAKIVAYFAPNTDAGFLDAITTAIHDTVNKPSVVSISWGGPESSWTQQAMSAIDSAFQAAATMGITVTVASGDNGSSDGATDGADHVDFPASSPFALACGGTNLQTSAGRRTGDATWNDGAGGGATGGGISGFFPVPAWQAGLSAAKTAGATVVLTGRGVPDVGGDADPETGYIVRVDGTQSTFGGTSAVAPLWAALIALHNASSASAAGYLNPTLYANQPAFNDVTAGNNGDFAAAAGWDACTGLGTPNGAALDPVL